MVSYFVGTICIYILLCFFKTMSVTLFNLHASTNMHMQMVERVIRSHIVFFDSNASGRIVTRF